MHYNEIRQYEEKANRAAAEALRDAKRTKEAAEIQARRGQVELQGLKDRLAFLGDQFATVQRSKKAELTTLADETETPPLCSEDTS